MHMSRTVRQTKIVGGTFATPHEFPYQINLRYHDELLCGGSILSTLFILTAAHCVRYKSPSKLSIVAGDHDHLLPEGKEQIRNVSNIFMHEHYDWDTDVNDIAILALSKPLEFNDYVKNISWPKKGMEFSGFATVTGWGKITESSPASDVLQKTRVPIVERPICQSSYKKVKMNVTESMLCAGETGKDSCRGDSGGPLTYLMPDTGELTQIGIVSHGIGCGRKGFPGVYTDLSKYNDWITTTMDQFSLKSKCKTNRFYCPDDKKCILRSAICNQINDGCSNGWDERGCEQFTRTPPSHFRCSNGVSIRASWVCDKMDDCGDSSDEEKCDIGPCALTQFSCKVDGRCIQKSWLCDDIIDCEDASDEADCGDNELIPAKGVTQSQNHGQTLSNSTRPPTTPNVTEDGSQCAKGSFRCPGNRIRGVCIPERWICDGQRDCRNGEDELNCTTISNSTSQTTGVTPAVINVTINSSTMPPPTSTSLTSAKPPQKNCTANEFFCNSSNLCIPRSFICDGDSDCFKGEDEVNCTINTTRRPIISTINVGGGYRPPVNFTKITVFSPFKPKTCLSTQFQCGSGECIPKSFRCDFDNDCLDHKDEEDCSMKPNCSTFQFQCNNGDCIYHRFRCDGEIDCLDATDEAGCNSRNISNNCTSPEFPCRTGECLPETFRCDTDEDCPNGEDEEGCPSLE